MSILLIECRFIEGGALCVRFNLNNRKCEEFPHERLPVIVDGPMDHLSQFAKTRDL